MFRRATLRLTISYSAIQLLLFGAFALGIYFFVTGTFDFDGVEQNGGEAVNAAEQGFALLRTALLISTVVVVFVVPLSSWWMARAALLPIETSFERQRQFVDGASHELRTPLSVIQGELELALAAERRPDQYRAAMSSALEATASVIALTNDLLQLSRTNADEEMSGATTVDLGALFTRLAEDSAAGAEARGIDLGFVASAGVKVSGTPQLLARAVGNVIDNALKYSARGGRVTVDAGVVGAAVHLRVRDEGRGMSPQEVARAFDRFWRADAARTTAGHGLGLPLVRQIAEAHGGSVKLESSEGVGTVVTITLPRI